MTPADLTPEHIAYWDSSDDVLGPATPVLFTGPGDVTVADIETVVTETARGQVVRVPWKPDEIELAHLARGGTLWLSCWGGLAPHMLEVQEP